jgi:hypothetical protein
MCRILSLEGVTLVYWAGCVCKFVTVPETSLESNQKASALATGAVLNYSQLSNADPRTFEYAGRGCGIGRERPDHRSGGRRTVCPDQACDGVARAGDSVLSPDSRGASLRCRCRRGAVEILAARPERSSCSRFDAAVTSTLSSEKQAERRATRSGMEGTVFPSAPSFSSN